MEQLSLTFEQLVPLGWRQAPKEHIIFCLERLMLKAYNDEDARTFSTLSAQHAKLCEYDQPSKEPVETGEMDRLDMEDALRDLGIDPEVIVKQVFK